MAGGGLLRALPEGAGVEDRWEHRPRSFTPVRRTDHRGRPAAGRGGTGRSAPPRRLAGLERARPSYDVQRAHDDPLVMAEYRLTGEAFAGTVTAADPEHTEGEGRSRKLRPLITVQTDDPVRLDARHRGRAARTGAATPPRSSRSRTERSP